MWTERVVTALHSSQTQNNQRFACSQHNDQCRLFKMFTYRTYSFARYYSIQCILDNNCAIQMYLLTCLLTKHALESVTWRHPSHRDDICTESRGSVVTWSTRDTGWTRRLQHRRTRSSTAVHQQAAPSQPANISHCYNHETSPIGRFQQPFCSQHTQLTSSASRTVYTSILYTRNTYSQRDCS